MTKTVPLYDNNLISIDVLHELHPDFIEKIRKIRQMFPHTKSQINGNPNK